jgi:transcriptional regulator with PAS, ATPase and Fis domain
MLRAQPWPGNVRELENLSMNLLLFDKEGTRVTGEQVARLLGKAAAEVPSASGPATGSLHQQVEAHERRLVQEALRRAGGNKAAAARELGVGIRTFYKILDRLGLSG